MARLTFLLIFAALQSYAVCAEESPRPSTYTSSAETSSKMGRLFFSPDERAMFDRVRNQNGKTSTNPTDQITLNGLVQRNSGKNTAWINQTPQQENESPQGIYVQQGQASKATAKLLLPSGKQVNLKAGQTFDTSKGTIRESYASPLDSSSQNTGN